MKRCLVTWTTGALLLALAAVPVWSGGSYPCEIVPYDESYETATGAEPGVVREFVSVIPIPEECRIDGDSFLLEAGFNMTRTAGGNPNPTVEIVVREAVATVEGGSFVPGVELIPPITAIVQDIPLFTDAVRHAQPLGHQLIHPRWRRSARYPVERRPLPGDLRDGGYECRDTLRALFHGDHAHGGRRPIRSEGPLPSGLEGHRPILCDGLPLSPRAVLRGLVGRRVGIGLQQRRRVAASGLLQDLQHE